MIALHDRSVARMLGGGRRHVKRHAALDMVTADTYGALYFVRRGPFS